MKHSARKKNRQEKSESAPVPPQAENNFYEPQPTETPLNERHSETGSRARRLSSLTSPARRRENDNRTTNRDLAILLLKIALIPILIVAGFFGLKAVVGLLDKPSEKEIQQREARAELMEKAPKGESLSSAEAAGEILINQAVLEERLDQWEAAERHLRAARALEIRGMEEEAIARLKQSLQFAPDSRDAQQLLLKLYIRSRDYAEAIPLCIRQLDQDSTQWEVKIALLNALQAEEKIEMCILLSDEMLLQQPGDYDILEVAAYAHAAAGNTDRALKIYEQILEDNPNDLLALKGCGHMHRWLKEWMDAVPYYLRLLDLNPRPEHYLALAQSYAQLDEPGKTVIILGQASSLYGTSTVAPWLSGPEFDPVRETAAFRSFLGQILGVQTRDAIEEIRRRDILRETPKEAQEFKLPSQTDLEILKPEQGQQR